MSATHLIVVPLGADRLGTEHLEACLASCPLPVAAVWRCGDWEDGPGSSVVIASGFSVLASDESLPDFTAAVAAALDFLDRHAEELAALSRHPSVSELRLLVPGPVTHREALSIRVPQRLADLASGVGVRVQVSGCRV